jgi:hypothetical protein
MKYKYLWFNITLPLIYDNFHDLYYYISITILKVGTAIAASQLTSRYTLIDIV